MKVLSLFDGISCGRVALERAGLHVSRYVAYEIDQDAINVSAWNWPEIEHEGSVEGADLTKYKGFDMVIGGFPCTDLSIGKNNREGLKGKHSRLFWEQVRAIKEINPRYFLVENNYRMPKKDEAIITETLGRGAIHINSAKVSAQNRDRLYWTNIPNVSQPDDKGLVLADILEAEVNLKYYHGEAGLNYFFEEGVKESFRTGKLIDPDTNKSRTLTSVMAKGLPHNGLKANTLCGSSRVSDLADGAQSGRVYDVNAKSVCLQSGGGGMGANTGLYAMPMNVGNLKGNSQGYRVYDQKGKGATLTTNGGGLAGSGGSLIALPVIP